MLKLHCGDSLEVLKTYPDSSVDSIVTDPPYGLTFMGKKWDYDVPTMEIWKECLRVLKPGGHLLAFGGTRTYHRLVVAIEDAGFEIRDQIQWIYGQGFPKSQDISKAIDKAAGVEIPQGDGRIMTIDKGGKSNGGSVMRSDHPDYKPREPATPDAKKWSGWGTALKPANEIVCLASKPAEEIDRYIAELSTHIGKILCQSQLFANAVERHLTSSQAGQSAAKSNTVLSLAKLNTLSQDDLLALMGMLQSESETNTFLSIAISWKLILDEVYHLKSTFTTETKSSLTTDLKILKSLQWETTHGNITKDQTLPAEVKSFVSIAGNLFYAVNMKLHFIQEHSAAGNAISPEAANSPVAGAKTSSKPICLARKPLSEKTVAANVLKHGTGGLNIDGTRIESPGETISNHARGADASVSKGKYGDSTEQDTHQTAGQVLGRFPANVIFDEAAAALLDQQSGVLISKYGKQKTRHEGESSMFGLAVPDSVNRFAGDRGGASRFFYVAKASKSDRGEGNTHATVKPTKLMEYLIKLVTPEGGVVLDPFMGSGTTGVAADNLGFDFVGIELLPEHFEICKKRLKQEDEFELFFELA